MALPDLLEWAGPDGRIIAIDPTLALVPPAQGRARESRALHADYPYAERLIGSIRRECLDHMIVLGERHLRRILTAYLTYYHGAQTHLALEKDAPTTRRVQTPPEGPVVAFPEVGRLRNLDKVARAGW